MLLPDAVTFSRNVFLPITNVCRNQCRYCGFRRDPAHPEANLMTVSEVTKGAPKNKVAKLFGDHPHLWHSCDSFIRDLLMLFLSRFYHECHEWANATNFDRLFFGEH